MLDSKMAQYLLNPSDLTSLLMKQFPFYKAEDFDVNVRKPNSTYGHLLIVNQRKIMGG